MNDVFIVFNSTEFLSGNQISSYNFYDSSDAKACSTFDQIYQNGNDKLPLKNVINLVRCYETMVSD